MSVLLACLLASALVHAGPLPPGVHASRPCNGPSAVNLPLERSVDAFSDAVYDLSFGSSGGRLSDWLALHYEGGQVLYVQLNDIGDEKLDGAALIREAIDGARVCDGGRVFPRRMNWSTTPRLWAAKHEALRIIDEYNTEFIAGQVFPVVFSLLMGEAAMGSRPPPVTRQTVSLPGRSSLRLRRSPPPELAPPPEAAPAGTPARSGTMRGGSAFDRVRRFDYAYRELFIEQPDGSYARLDAYDPLRGEIVSRKFTQFAEIKEKTAVGYLHELSRKYQPGFLIARVPSSGPLAGRELRGIQILEVPIQTQPVPRAILDRARALKIIIRDVAGTEYR